MDKKIVNDSSLELVADEIRAKGGTTEELAFPQGFVQGIRNLPEPGTVDTEMSDTSENAVQNKVIKAYVDSEIENKETTTLQTQIATTPTQPTTARFEDGDNALEFGKAGDVYEMHISKGDSQNTAFLTTQKYVDDALANKADKTEIPEVDSEISETSTNPIQNKIIKEYVDETNGQLDESIQANAAAIEALQNEKADTSYVDNGLDGKQDALAADGTYYVDAEIGGEVVKLATKAYVDSKDPFMLIDFNRAIDLSIPYCTENIANTSIPNVDVVINDELGAEWAIASLAKYEVKNSSGQRLNCWPVCSFSMNGQKTLRLRMMCAGTSRQTAASINGAILLKRR